jgi:ABC-2 type transport system ATP-binding protein
MGELSGLAPYEALERTHEILHFLGVGEERYRRVGTYSTGMRQLTKLAVAAVHSPPLLILDEPTNGLDAAARRRMVDILLQIRDSGHTRLLISSHLLHDVEACCDEVLILREGRLVRHSDLDRERRTNRKFLNVEVVESPTAFLAEARRRGCEATGEEPPMLRMVLPEGMEILEIYRMAAETGTRIHRLSYKRDSLEDIFMQAMELDRDSP